MLIKEIRESLLKTKYYERKVTKYKQKNCINIYCVQNINTNIVGN